MVFILSSLWWRRIRSLWQLPDRRDWLRGKLGLVLMSGTIPSKSLFQWNQTVVEVMKIVATSFKMPYAHTAALSPSAPAASHRWPTPSPETPGHSQASLGQYPVVSPNSFLLDVVHTRFCLSSPRVCTPVLCKFCNQILLASKVKFPQSLSQIPRLENLLWVLEL